MVYELFFLLSALIIIIGIALYVYRQRLNLERERTVLLMQQEALLEQSAQLRKTVDRCRGYREEIARMMAGSGLFGTEEGEQDAPLPPEEVPEEEMVSPETGTYCNNVVVQAVLQHKEIECHRRKIPLQMDLEGIDAVSADDMDLVGIFYNLLDNAIEASLRLPDPQDRRIDVSSRIEQKHWVLCVKNRCLPPDESALRRGTWKEDPEHHGIGQTILRDLVRMNRGRIRMEQKDGSYQVEIRMPVKRKAA